MWESVKFWWGEQGGEVILAFLLKSGSALYQSEKVFESKKLEVKLLPLLLFEFRR